MGGSTKLPKPQPVRLPTSDSSLIRDTRASTTADIQNRGGFSSTILSEALRSLTGSIGFLGR